MKSLKIVIFICALFLYVTSNAQNIAFQVGANFSKFTENSSDKFALQPGLLLGPIAEMGISKNVFLKSGILFTTKGDKRLYKGTIMPDIEYSVRYIQVPLNLVVKKNLKVTKIFMQAGPYAGYALSGNKKVADAVTELDFKNVDFGDRMDYGIGIGAGIEIRHIYGGINFEAGLTDVYKYSTSTGKNLTGSIYIGYRLFRN